MFQEYAGLRSLIRVEYFTFLYMDARARVASTYNIELDFQEDQLDFAYNEFIGYFIPLLHKRFKARKFLILSIALSIQATSKYQMVTSVRDVADRKVVRLGRPFLDESTINEMIALQFGIGVYMLERARIRKKAQFYSLPPLFDINLISFPEIRSALQTITNNRSADVSADNGQFLQSFKALRRMLRNLS